MNHFILVPIFNKFIPSFKYFLIKVFEIFGTKNYRALITT